MECLQGAFKSGFGPAEEVAFSDDYSAVALNGSASAANGDDLFVDELLDFSDDVVFETEGQLLLLEPPEQNKACSVSLEKQSVAVDSSPIDHFGSLPETVSSDPVAEGLESLEWLSHFVEDSFSEHALPGKLHLNPVQNVPETPSFAAHVQTKARTKRARSGVRVWPVLSSSSSSISSTSSSSSSTASAAPPNKVQKRRPADAATQHQQQPPRKCSHCGVTKTPQWRAGPLGPKTLCNACGVRFKSGRLLPEYRPACIPTFSGELHSNNHRKVLEMRKKKESENGPAGSAPPAAAHNF